MRTHEAMRRNGRLMTARLPRNPIIYEINTWVWLRELSDRLGRPITLTGVPNEELDSIAAIGVDAVWLMGVWERSAAGIDVSNRNASQQAEFRQVLPDYAPEDNVGSPYCVRRYVVDQRLGGPNGLAAVRKSFMQRGVRLILDFVPNHVALDHPWVIEHPDYFLQGTQEDLRRAPDDFFEVGGGVIANGRDPFFPAWRDVAQLNPFNLGLRQAVIETIDGIAAQSDGIRCDMAMLLINNIFARTWGSRTGSPPATEYWVDVISAIRRKHPGFGFIAEAYWDLEWTLQQQGFDYCYDKRLYDRLVHDDAGSVQGHLWADIDYQNKLLRFIENHDEPRAAAVFSPEKGRAAALVIATTPGAKLFHQGQFEGYRVRIPVFLGRPPVETVDQALCSFYSKLLEVIRQSQLLEGEWQLCAVEGWPDNPSYRNIVSWVWQRGNRRILIAVNLSEGRSQALIRIPWAAEKPSWRLVDLMNGDVYERNGRDLSDSGLFVDLPGWHCHFLEFWCPAREMH